MKIIITNGIAQSGKDTVARMLSERMKVVKLSSIDGIKALAREVGWNGVKDERSRKFLSDLKLLLSAYNDYPFEYIKQKVLECPDDAVVLIDIREPNEIAKAADYFDAITVLVQRDSVKQITSNFSDANVYDYEYQYCVNNNGSLDDLEIEVDKLAVYINNVEENR